MATHAASPHAPLKHPAWAHHVAAAAQDRAAAVHGQTAIADGHAKAARALGGMDNQASSREWPVYSGRGRRVCWNIHE